MATFAIGDIHGCLTALDTIIKGAGITASDTLVFLGDYVDRGPHSRGVIDRILNLTEVGQLVTLRGNHEVMMLNARQDAERLFSWLHYGGETTLSSYGYDDSPDWMQCIPDEHWTFLENTTRFFETDTHIFVHAGLHPKVPLEEQNDTALFWKKQYKPPRYSKDKIVVCGHTTFTDGKIANFGHTVCLDTYAYGGQWLSCLEVGNNTYWQASNEGELRSGTLDQS